DALPSLPQLAIESGEQLLARLTRQQLSIQLGFEGRTTDPAQTSGRRIGKEDVEPGERAPHQFQARRYVVFADEAKQTNLIHLSETTGLRRTSSRFTHRHGDRWTRMVEADAE